MKLIIAGSRQIYWYRTFDLNELITTRFDQYPTEIICGLAKGPDLLGKEWAIEHNVPVREFPAMWDLHGKRAGFIRNRIMAKEGDYLLALWDGKSRGTLDMILCMLHQDPPKPVHVELCE